MKSRITPQDAAKLVAEIKDARIFACAQSGRIHGGDHGTRRAMFLGGLQSVIGHFVEEHCGADVRAALDAAMDYKPTEDEIKASNAAHDALFADVRRAA